ncbi:hypothetical protein HELRODRAFT_142800, partial [Helobdella robusta]|uniref:Rho-GAP domain-containing protein n=1 Tax=Helobdella robusta TaxID=6412 RepID=T1EJ76_HELRO
RVKFGLPLSEAFKDNVIPVQLLDMLIYIARDGVTTTDLFRRPGNPTDTKNILKKMADGRDVEYSNYNFYTLASVIKKFLLKIPGGIFGIEAENQLLQVLNINEKLLQFDAINKIIRSLPECTQHLISLLFGTWFRMAHHSDHNSMSSESVAKSVAGSLFHTC